MNPVKLTTKAPAKINLDLFITGRRDDGYHLLDSIFIPILSLFDTVSVTCSEGAGISLEVVGCDEIPSDAGNLVWKAAEKIIKLSKLNISVEIELTKRIPVAAGLGGGSSDAAAVLRLINQYFEEKGQGVSSVDLKNIALTIGADVPFFLNPRLSRVSGIGEQVEPINPTEQKFLLIISPNFHISANDAYKLYRNSSKPFSKPDRSINNDLESVVAEKYVALRTIREIVSKLSNVQHFAMSGSGPCYFALFDSKDVQLSAEKSLNTSYPFLNTFSTVVEV